MEITQLSLPLHINVRVCCISNVVYTLNGNIVTLAGMSTLENLWMSKWQPSDSKVHGANMRPTWIQLAPDGPHVCPMNLAIRVSSVTLNIVIMTCLLQYIDISWSVSLLLQRGHLSNNYTLCFRTGYLCQLVPVTDGLAPGCGAVSRNCKNSYYDIMWNPEALNLYVKIICCFTNWQVPLQQYGTDVCHFLNNIKLVIVVLWLKHFIRFNWNGSYVYGTKTWTGKYRSLA